MWVFKFRSRLCDLGVRYFCRFALGIDGCDFGGFWSCLKLGSTISMCDHHRHRCTCSDSGDCLDRLFGCPWGVDVGGGCRPPSIGPDIELWHDDRDLRINVGVPLKFTGRQKERFVVVQLQGSRVRILVVRDDQCGLLGASPAYAPVHIYIYIGCWLLFPMQCYGQ